MKIVSLPTLTRSNGYEVKGDITLFFEFTDEQYERFINTNFDNIWQVLDALIAWSDDYWNIDAFNDELYPSENLYEHTTQTDISFFEI